MIVTEKQGFWELINAGNPLEENRTTVPIDQICEMIVRNCHEGYNVTISAVQKCATPSTDLTERVSICAGLH
jgi:hypothetical protein